MSRSDWGGKDADMFNVQLGDVYQVGRHVLACGDLELGHAQRLLDHTGNPDITYTDPPWNTGIAKAFRTQAGVPRDVHFPTLMQHVIHAVGRTKREAIVEMGIAECGYVMQELEEFSRGKVLGAWSATYGSKKLEMRMIHVGYNGHASTVSHELGHAWAVTRRVLRELIQSPEDLVFDPCMGLGGTFREASKLGAHVVGMELNPKRLSTTLAWATAHGHGEPVKIGTLGP